MNISSRNQRIAASRGQAIVEFAVALPVLMVLLVGILEAGRMIMIYTSVSNASREAARYASAVGQDDSGYYKYKYCAGIRDTATRSAFLVTLNSVTITYDTGPGTSVSATCDAASGEDSDITASIVDTGSRVKVTVQATYRPMLKLLPLRTRNFTSISARTILGIYELDN